MHDDVTRPESIGVVTLKSKIAASNASNGGNSKSTGSRLSESLYKSPEPLKDDPATSDLEYMSALLPFKIPASGKYEVYWLHDISSISISLKLTCTLG